MSVFTQENLMRAKEVALILNFPLSTVMSWANKGKIPCVKLGAGKRLTVRFEPKKLNEWLSNHEVLPQENDLINHYPNQVKVKKLKDRQQKEFEHFVKGITS